MARRKMTSTAVGLILLGSLAFIIAALLASFRPVNVVRCTAERRCRIERWIGGVYFLYADELSQVHHSAAQSNIVSSRTKDGYVSSIKETLILQSRTGSISTDPTTYPMGSGSERIVRDLERYFAAHAGAEHLKRSFSEDDPDHYVAWQGESAMLILAALLPLLGLWSLRAAVKRLFFALRGV